MNAEAVIVAAVYLDHPNLLGTRWRAHTHTHNVNIEIARRKVAKEGGRGMCVGKLAAIAYIHTYIHTYLGRRPASDAVGLRQSMFSVEGVDQFAVVAYL